EIPLLFRDSVDVVRGLFDAEGHVGIDTQRHGDKQYRYPYACLDMIAKPVVIQSHHILSAHSIQSSYHRKQPHSWGKHPQWRLLVKGRENMEKFKEQIGFRHPAKAKRLEEILSEGGILRDHTPRTHDG
ncbi:MAG: LAGLIDADG family homing endonuclease, partial [Candidatus Nitrosocaldus sp.]|nr:LAGLIDADG family homing endonuclease [Candidatus Nitrosocaldus sp.]